MIFCSKQVKLAGIVQISSEKLHKITLWSTFSIGMEWFTDKKPWTKPPPDKR